MSERVWYVLCGDDCRAESLTREQIIAAIAEATGNTPTSVDDAFITKIKETGGNTNITFWRGTEAQFNALGVTAPAMVLRLGSDGKLYVCTDDSTLDGYATDAEIAGKYDKPLRATNVSVATSAWASNATYTDYPYRAAVAVTGCTAAMTPDVVFELTDAVSGILAPVAECYNGGVYIYAAEVPAAAVTIATLTIWGVV